MRRGPLLATVVALAALLAVPAIAADSKDKKKKDGPILRWAKTYESAVAEAKERNCVIFVTIHAEH
ncbi:MAG: hypothetical protein IT460_13320 [Planctomycetes bacterium]|nr:hypothetical protein [Planctomycetota bacterium]